MRTRRHDARGEGEGLGQSHRHDQVEMMLANKVMSVKEKALVNKPVGAFQYGDKLGQLKSEGSLSPIM